MKPALRRGLLFTGLAATLAAVGWVSQVEEEAVPAPAAPRQARAGVPAEPAATVPGNTIAALADPDVEQLQQRTVSRDFGEMFPGRSWLPPPPPPPPPPAPRAPPLPFTFFGRMIDGQQTVVFLAQRDQTFAVKAGETVAGSYRIEEIGPTAVIVTYLPLKERQTLNIGEIN